MNPETEKKLKDEATAGEYAVKVIAALLHEEPLPDIPGSITWRCVFGLAFRHSVNSMLLYAAEEQIKSEPDLFQLCERKQQVNLLQSITQIREKKLIINALTADGIRVLPVKGCVLKEMYPQIDWRQMCDLDMLIDEENVERARAVMESMGYTKRKATVKDDSYLKKPFMNVELHHKLFEDWYPATEQYYDNIWEKAVPDPDNNKCFFLAPEDEYIYQMAHFDKHYAKEYGAGIRSILDIAIYNAHFCGKLDRKYILGEVKKLGISEVVKTAEGLAEKWFGSQEHRKQPLSRAEQNMAQIVLLSGTYGNYLSRTVRDVVQTESSTLKRIQYALRRAFLSVDEMRRAYPVLKKFPIIYPVCVIHRLVTKHSRISSELDAIFKKETSDS